jgi:1,4-alpha-glucan branching enzyme
MYRFYQDIITLSRRLDAIRGHNIHLLHQSNDNRVLACKRWSGGEEVIVVASLNNTPFAGGYTIQADTLSIPDAHWREIFNSDAAAYGGANIGNAGAAIPSAGGRLTVTLPARGMILFARE